MVLPGNRVFGRLALVCLASILLVALGGSILQAYGCVAPEGPPGLVKWSLMVLLGGASVVFVLSIVPLGARALVRRVAAADQRSDARKEKAAIEDPDRMADAFTLFVWAVWMLGAAIAIPAMIIEVAD